MEWNTACPDWRERLRAGRSLAPSLPLVEEEANFGIAIFNEMRLPDVIGQPKLATHCGPWFRDIARVFFGSYDPARHLRHIREFFVLVPKKNSKSTYCAALMLTQMLMNKRPYAEFIIVAPTQEIAQTAFSKAGQMAGLSPELVNRFNVVWGKNTIQDIGNGSLLKIKTFDEDIVTGAIPAGILIDELHLLGRKANAARVLGQVYGGMLPNPDSFVFKITTQSDLRPAGVFKADLEIARKVRDGELKNHRLLPILYEFPEDIAESGGWRDPVNWPMVTPNAGYSIPLDELKIKWEEAQIKGEEEVRRWASQHLNIEIGVHMHEGRWSGAEVWERQADPSLRDFREIIRRCDVVVGGADGGGRDDLFGVCLLGRDATTKDWLCWTHAWAHRSLLERRKSIASLLTQLEGDGDLTIVDDELDDIRQIVEIFQEAMTAGVLAGVAVDPAAIGELVTALDEIGITIENKMLLPVRQGIALMNAIKTVERKLTNGTFRHGGTDLMNWCVGNLKIEPTATAIRATREAATTDKIDPAMAMFDAASVMSMNPVAQGSSGWATDDIDALMAKIESAAAA